MDRLKRFTLLALAISAGILSTGCTEIVGTAARNSFTTFVTQVITNTVNASS